MGLLQQFRKRHYFQHVDNRAYMEKWILMKKKRMWGVWIDPDFNKFHYLTWNYTLARINDSFDWETLKERKFSMQELELLVALVHENRGVTVQDIVNFPSGLTYRQACLRRDRLVKLGILERFEGHGSWHHRGVVYRITKKARQWVSDLNAMQLGYKKIPLIPLKSNEEFSKRKNANSNNKKPNWYANVVRFNEWVEKNMNEHKDLKNYENG